MNPSPTIYDVRNFWEKNPLFSGESKFPLSSKEFFEEHRQTIIEDNFAGEIPNAYFKNLEIHSRILDLGCGPGFWLVEFYQRGYQNIFGCDLTFNALKMSQLRCDYYNISSPFLCQQNAEQLGFKNESFHHVNCKGVIHHTPNTEVAIREIYRILKTNGTAGISVYYKNVFLWLWPIFSWIGKILSLLGAKFRGRGREKIFSINNVDNLVRYFDGADNPIGKCYTRRQFFTMLAPYFEIIEWSYHLFPARSLPFRIPKSLHRFLNRHFGFMLDVKVRKRNLE